MSFENSFNYFSRMTPNNLFKKGSIGQRGFKKPFLVKDIFYFYNIFIMEYFDNGIF